MSWMKSLNKTLNAIAIISDTFTGGPFKLYLRKRNLKPKFDSEFNDDISILNDIDRCNDLNNSQCIDYIDVNRNLGPKSFLACLAFLKPPAASQLLNFEELTNIFGTLPSPIDLISLQILFSNTGDDDLLALTEERILQQPKENFLHDFIWLIHRPHVLNRQQIIRFYMMYNYSITTSSTIIKDPHPDLQNLLSKDFTIIESNIYDRYFDEIFNSK